MRPQPGPHDSHWGNSVACASSPSVAPSLTQTQWGISHPSVSHRQPSAPGSAPGSCCEPTPRPQWPGERSEAEPTGPGAAQGPRLLLRKARPCWGCAVPPHTGPGPSFHSGFCVSGCPCRFAEAALGPGQSCLGASRLAFWCFFSCDHLPPGQDINVQFKQQQ